MTLRGKRSVKVELFEIKKLGKVKLSFELMPVSDAERLKNGIGRDSPNQNPNLPEPTGRLSFDIANPLEFVKDVIGPNLYNKYVRGKFYLFSDSTLYNFSLIYFCCTWMVCFD